MISLGHTRHILKGSKRITSSTKSSLGLQQKKFYVNESTEKKSLGGMICCCILILSTKRNFLNF